MNSFLNNKTAAFLKRSFFFALLSATLLYSVIRLFFYDFPFTIREGFELSTKIMLTIWIFVVVGKLAFTFIILLENNISEMKTGRTRYRPLLKKTAFIILAAALAYAGKTQRAVDTGSTDSCSNVNDEPATDMDSNFIVKLPS